MSRLFYLKYIASVKNLVDIFRTYLHFSGVRTNSECEIANKCLLKRAKDAVCGLKQFDLTVDKIKKLDVHFPHDRKFQQGITFLSLLQVYKSLFSSNSRNKKLYIFLYRPNY